MDYEDLEIIRLNHQAKISWTQVEECTIHTSINLTH